MCRASEYHGETLVRTVAPNHQLHAIPDAVAVEQIDELANRLHGLSIHVDDDVPRYKGAVCGDACTPQTGALRRRCGQEGKAASGGISKRLRVLPRPSGQDGLDEGGKGNGEEYPPEAPKPSKHQDGHDDRHWVQIDDL